ncbi:uncharacterized protein LOC141854719 [Brevipalpus obovatus]|uniref:uncharacterized protein LOC141854719 n=1 Tax=Brevipalpus obovatus TaxID=246614 RepID=UPI003D9F5521
MLVLCLRNNRTRLGYESQVWMHLPVFQVNLKILRCARRFSQSSSSSASSSKARGRIDYYTVLGVKSDCEPKQLKTAYFDKCREYHPDTTTHKDLTPEQLHQKFQEVQEAYQILSDEKSRLKFDSTSKPVRKPSGFKTRVHSKFGPKEGHSKFGAKEVHRDPESYENDPYSFQRQRFWSEMQEELKKQAEYEKNAPGKRYKRHEIVIFVLLLVFLIDSIRYLKKPKKPEP